MRCEASMEKSKGKLKFKFQVSSSRLRVEGKKEFLEDFPQAESVWPFFDGSAANRPLPTHNSQHETRNYQPPYSDSR